MRRSLLAALGLCLLFSAVPTGAAHGQMDAAELEWYVLEDEADDSFYVAGGYDLYQVYVGEAYEPEVGRDGVYFRTVLYGDPAAGVPPGGDLAVAFTFLVGDEAVTRTVSTADGKTFTGDFDLLRAEPGDGEVGLYAFVAGDDLGLVPGTELRDLTVVSLYGGEPRDVAPGGLYAPGSMGTIEVPYPSAGRLVDTMTLEGTGRYFARVDAQDLGEGGWLVEAESALQRGGQHVMLQVPEPTPGWRFEPSGALSEAADPKGIVRFGFTLTPAGDPGDTLAPMRLDVLTDLGGRHTLVAVNTPDGVRIVPEDEVAALESAPLAGELATVPSAGALLALAALGAAVIGRRR